MSEEYSTTLNSSVGSFAVTELFGDYSESQKMVDGIAYADSADLMLKVEAYDDVTVSEAQAETAMMAEIATACPSTWRGQILKNVSLKERCGGYLWKVGCDYASAERSKSATPRYDRAIIALDFSGQQQIKTECIATPKAYPSDPSPPDTVNLIGWDGRQLNGVAVDYAVMKVNFRFLKRKVEVNGAYYESIYTLYNTVNNAPFKNFALGTLRMCGASLTEREDGDFDITFTFEADKTHKYSELGTIFEEITIPPHHYLDVKYKIIVEAFSEGARKMEVPVAEFAWVRKIYEDGDFSLLQIP